MSQQNSENNKFWEILRENIVEEYKEIILLERERESIAFELDSI